MKFGKKLSKTFLILMVLCTNCAISEWFSSLGQMKDLVDTELELITSLENYIAAENEKLKVLSRYLKKFQNNTRKPKETHDEYLNHPINQYHLIKRLSVEWKEIAGIVVESSEHEFMPHFQAKQNFLPKEEDLKGSAVALMRLQDTYQLDTSEMMHGNIKNFSSNHPLQIEDCYHIGQTAYGKEDYYHCSLWMKKVLDAMDESYTLINKFDVMDYLAVCLGKTTNQHLKCYYWTNHNQPRLLLQPIKLEELSDSPRLVRFYDVLYEDEIEQIKVLAKPHLHRATVHNPKTGRLESALYRVSKSAWFADSDHHVVARVSRRISAITGLSMETAESLQVANYGVAGQYEPHFDFHKDDNVPADEGNRIATFLIYLSDVQFGGSTVFLYPDIAVQPIKGSAVFWYNLKPSGEGDMRTRHAACPVLVGLKWVANKWIHERGQEFARRCSLNEFDQ